jgi:hypothetical protein
MWAKKPTRKYIYIWSIRHLVILAAKPNFVQSALWISMIMSFCILTMQSTELWREDKTVYMLCNTPVPGWPPRHRFDQYWIKSNWVRFDQVHLTHLRCSTNEKVWLPSISIIRIRTATRTWNHEWLAEMFQILR